MAAPRPRALAGVLCPPGDRSLLTALVRALANASAGVLLVDATPDGAVTAHVEQLHAHARARIEYMRPSPLRLDRDDTRRDALALLAPEAAEPTKVSVWPRTRDGEYGDEADEDDDDASSDGGVGAAGRVGWEVVFGGRDGERGAGASEWKGRMGGRGARG